MRNEGPGQKEGKRVNYIKNRVKRPFLKLRTKKRIYFIGKEFQGGRGIEMHYTYPLLYVILYLDYQPNIKEMCALATVIVTVKTQPMRISCTASKGASRRTRLSDDRTAPMTRMPHDMTT